MVCKNCKRDIYDDSIFCKWCGEKQIRERRKKGEVKVPKPRQLASGEYIGQIMIDGQRHTVKGATLAEYEAKCKAYKAGVVEAKRGAAGVTVGELVVDCLVTQRRADLFELCVDVPIQFDGLLVAIGVCVSERDLGVLFGNLLVKLQLVPVDGLVVRAIIPSRGRVANKSPGNSTHTGQGVQCAQTCADDAGRQTGCAYCVRCVFHVLYLLLFFRV